MASALFVIARVLLLWGTIAWCGTMNFEGADGETLQTKTFRSPSFILGPGDVIDKFLPVAMPTGHIAVRSLDMTVVDSDGSQIPLTETYLHHWLLMRYYIDPISTNMANLVPVLNSGVCGSVLGQWFGHGSEFRHTNTTVPPPYGIVLGNPNDVPKGLEEAWFLNVHAVDTRGAVDPRGCIECHCNVYNVTMDGDGNDLPPGYEGGMDCCSDESHCPLRLGFQGVEREVFLEFTITFVDYSDAVVPVKVYYLDVTDQRKAWDQPPQCMVEYTVPKCALGAAECVHTKEGVAFLPKGGYVVYATAHLHNSGVVASISRESGDEICVSHPIYGQGTEAGNETGYVVGMTSCYPDPASIYVRSREKLQLKASYNNDEQHTGVMGVFVLLVADTPRPPFLAEYSVVVQAVLDSLMALVIIAAVVMGVLRVNRWWNKRRAGLNYKPIDVVSTTGFVDPEDMNLTKTKLSTTAWCHGGKLAQMQTFENADILEKWIPGRYVHNIGLTPSLSAPTSHHGDQKLYRVRFP